MSVAETLRAAARLIEHEGLACCGEYFDSQGRICVMEAVWRAATGTQDAAGWRRAVLDGKTDLNRQNKFRYAMQTLERHLSSAAGYHSVPWWSDSLSGNGIRAAETLRRIADQDEQGS